MNKNERLMSTILKRGKNEFGVVGVKAEFEAEGTRIDELLRLLDIARDAGVTITVKIGGCEAVRDLLEAKQIGVRYIVAPMVETPYALSKFISAKNSVFSIEEQKETSFLFNLETITGFQNLQSLLSLSNKESGISGIVFGRVDFSGSLGLGRAGLEDEKVTESILTVARACLDNSLDLVLGGAISIDSLPIVQRVANIHLTRFETRKIIFDGAFVNNVEVKKGLLNAIHFELLWLLNKRDYYNTISAEDSKRIDMLEARWNLLNTSIL